MLEVIFGKTSSITTKSGDNNQVLTETDLAVGRLIVGKIKETFPTHNIIDEEAGVIDNKSEFTWVVDPIDGTSNFANGIPTYGIILGLLREGKVISGGCALPFFQQICIQEGKGTYLNGEKIFVTKEVSLLKCLVAYHVDGHQEDPEYTRKETDIMKKIILGCRNIRTSGCQPFDGLFVANGSYSALLNQTAKIWDTVGMQIIIEEAGGIYTDFWGNPIDYTNPLEKVGLNFYTLCSTSCSTQSTSDNHSQ